MNKFYLTTPIYYPNARPHVGSAYTTIVCDAIARYKRMCGHDVAFLTGTDEHGEKLQRAADAAGVPVERFVAEKRELFKDLWRTLGIPQYSPEHPAGYRFVHTSQNPAHVKSVHWMIQQADKAGYIAKKKYEGRYCVYDERYVSDSPEPVNCDICGRPAELISEENYFFKLSAFQDRLLKLYKERPEFVQPDFRMNEVKSFVKSGLRDISISRRRLKWGIPWPDDREQVVYVWYDALTSYLTGIGFEGDKRSREFEKYWMGAEGPSEVVHMIGKDILRFHAIYWPAFLMAAKLPLPKTIFAHGWIYYEQDKMSKSKGNVVYPEPIVDALDSFGVPGNDALRYYLLRDTTFGQDASFSYEGLLQRHNSDLANDLGNLASRTITMIRKYCDTVIPSRPPDFDQINNRTSTLKHIVLTDLIGINGSSAYGMAMHRHDFAEALHWLWSVVAELNKYIVMAAPWKIWKESESLAYSEGAFDVEGNPIPTTSSPESADTLHGVLYTAADVLRMIAILAHPLVPDSSKKIWHQLGCEGNIEDQRFEDLQWGSLKPGTKVGKPEPVFPRLDKQVTLRKLDELAEQDRERDQPKETTLMSSEDLPAVSRQPSATTPSPEPRPLTPAFAADQKISIDDFAKVEMRVGQVLAAEPIPGATKLLKLQVDIGSEVRQVCAGIAEYYKPDDLIGMKVVIVTNLQPRKLRGIESNGMIVAASVGPDGKPVLATFKEEVPNGARLK